MEYNQEEENTIKKKGIQSRRRECHQEEENIIQYQKYVRPIRRGGN